MDTLPYEIIELIMNFTTREELVLFSKLSKACHETCNRLPYKLRILCVDYKDENSFIYKYNKVNIKDYKKNGAYDYQKIYDLYLQNAKLKEIHCDYMQITSVPILPKMIAFYGECNQLTNFPIQPEMTEFYGRDNQLISFPVQPKMTAFCGSNNQLISFPVQPEMLKFYARGNQFTNFPCQPKITQFYGSDN